MQVGFQNQGPANQPVNLAQQICGQQAMANAMFPRDRAPQTHVEAYQQVPEPQPTHRQDVDAYWADKIAEVMRDQFGIKPKVNTYSYRTSYPLAYDLIPLPNGTRCQISLNSLDKKIRHPWNMSIGSSSSVERLLSEMN